MGLSIDLNSHFTLPVQASFRISRFSSKTALSLQQTLKRIQFYFNLRWHYYDAYQLKGEKKQTTKQNTSYRFT